MLVRIEQQLAQLSRTERRVGEWVLRHPRQAADATLKEVSAATGVSEPTIVRFCRHVGLAGFRELTLRLTEALSQPVSYVHSDVHADDAMPDAVTKVLDASIQALLNLRGSLSALPISAAVDALADARQIVFAGLGASGYVARDASHKFFRLGIPCSSLADSPGILQFAAVAAEGDVLVLNSHTGGWRELADAARLAREGGATVVALTAPGSALARNACIVLPLQIVEDTSVYTPMSSRLAQLALLDAVHVALALRLGPAAVIKLRDSKQALSSLV
ncbi:MAG: SIS domain-containing protein [Pseudomonadota bacterium]